MAFQWGLFNLCAAHGHPTKNVCPEWGRTIFLAGVLFGLSFAITGWADRPADPSEQQFIDGLLERRLYPLAAEYCQDQLTRGDLSQTRRTALVVDLSRTYTTWAIHSPPRKAGRALEKSAGGD